LTVAAVTDDSFAYSMTTDKGDSSYRLLHINDGAPTGWRKKQKIDVQVLSQLTCESAAKNSKGEKSSSQLPWVKIISISWLLKIERYCPLLLRYQPSVLNGVRSSAPSKHDGAMPVSDVETLPEFFVATTW